MLERQGSSRTVLGRVVSYLRDNTHRSDSPFDRLHDYEDGTLSLNSWLQDFSSPRNLASALGQWKNSTAVNISIAGTLPFEQAYNEVEIWPPDRIKGEMFVD